MDIEKIRKIATLDNCIGVRVYWEHNRNSRVFGAGEVLLDWAIAVRSCNYANKAYPDISHWLEPVFESSPLTALKGSE